MTTLTGCDTADHQFLVQVAIQDDAMPLEIGYLPS